MVLQLALTVAMLRSVGNSMARADLNMVDEAQRFYRRLPGQPHPPPGAEAEDTVKLLPTGQDLPSRLERE